MFCAKEGRKEGGEEGREGKIGKEKAKSSIICRSPEKGARDYTLYNTLRSFLKASDNIAITFIIQLYIECIRPAKCILGFAHPMLPHSSIPV